MAKKGLSKLVLADYSAEGNTVTYSNATNQEKLASYSWEVTRSNTDDLYLDNAVAETDGGNFSSGNLTLETGDLMDETSKKILNVKTAQVSVGSGNVTEIILDDKTTGKTLGVGLMELHQVNNVDFYRAIWFPKVQFSIPAGSATTKGASVEWQTQEITGTILRSDAVGSDGGHPWQTHADFETEAEALAYLMVKAS
jgi:phi13 family phage major tail protein